MCVLGGGGGPRSVHIDIIVRSAFSGEDLRFGGNSLSLLWRKLASKYKKISGVLVVCLYIWCGVWCGCVVH